MATKIHNDIEVGIRNHSEDTSSRDVLCFKTLCIAFIYTVTIPFIVCDFYYAYTDTSCVEAKAGNLIINIKNYLQVNGFLNSIILLGITWLILVAENIDKYIKETIVLSTFVILITIFNAAWTITGAIMFWGLIDNMECNKGVYNYMYANLIIKLILIFFSKINRQKKK
jgi:membrane-bound metal-dependent hydrolase YbcI (DUF457 family)